MGNLQWIYISRKGLFPVIRKSSALAEAHTVDLDRADRSARKVVSSLTDAGHENSVWKKRSANLPPRRWTLIRELCINVLSEKQRKHRTRVNKRLPTRTVELQIKSLKKPDPWRIIDFQEGPLTSILKAVRELHRSPKEEKRTNRQWQNRTKQEWRERA